MAEILIPIGHDIGPVYSRVGDTVPKTFDIRAGAGSFQLDAPELLTWELLHGRIDDSELEDGIGRGKYMDLAAEAEIPNYSKTLASLIQVGAVLPIDLDDETAAHEFATHHRIIPLRRGNGNSPAAPWMFIIESDLGLPITISADAYYLWVYSHLQPSLWDACLTMAKEQEELAADSAETTPQSPQELLREILAVLPQLLAGNAVYVDRSI